MTDPCKSLVDKIHAASSAIASAGDKLHAGAGNKKAGLAAMIKEQNTAKQKAEIALRNCRLGLIEAKHKALGGDAGFLGARVGSANECDDGAGWFCNYQH